MEYNENQNNDRGMAINPYQSPMYNYGSSIIYLTNPEQELFKMELALRNQILDKDGEIKTLGNPILNDEGIGLVIGATQGLVNQITIMSSLDTKKEIYPLINHVGDTLIKLLMLKSKSYELDTNNKDYIMSLFYSFAFICMKRAVSDGLSDKKFWRGSVTEVHNQTSQEKKPGLLGRLWNK